MALNLLLILVISAELEHLFFNTKVTFQDYRNKLGIDIIKVIKCIKSWLKTYKVAWVNNIKLVFDTAIMEEDE